MTYNNGLQDGRVSHLTPAWNRLCDRKHAWGAKNRARGRYGEKQEGGEQDQKEEEERRIVGDEEMRVGFQCVHLNVQGQLNSARWNRQTSKPTTIMKKRETSLTFLSSQASFLTGRRHIIGLVAELWLEFGEVNAECNTRMKIRRTTKSPPSPRPRRGTSSEVPSASLACL
eukprot:746332-Hanusia_phi.AAC.19